MRYIRMYVATILQIGDTIALPPEAHRHSSKVLRLRRGDLLTLFNGNGRDYQARIIDSDKKQTLVLIEQETLLNNESPLNITLYLALLKGEAFDRSIQKAVELGVNRIVPIYTARSERRIHSEREEKKYEHWRGIIISAAMQCGRAVLPELSPARSLAEAVAEPQHGLRWIFSPHDAPAPPPARDEAPKTLALLIGAEGGLTAEEVQTALAADWQPQSLGRRILRADTAVIAALVRAQSAFGDLG